MSVSTVVAETWIKSKLAANSTLTALLADGTSGIWLDVAPRTAGTPLVLTTYSGDAGYKWILNEILWGDLVYIVRGVRRGTSYGGDLATIAAEIMTSLNQQSGVTGDGTVFASYALRPFRLAEVDDDINYRHLGHFFRVTAKES